MTFLQKCKRLLTVFRRFWEPIPRKIRIFLLLALSMPAGFFCYVFMECPDFSMEMHYRRAEKANMVGPAEILDILELENYYYNRMVVADDGDGVIIYGLADDDDHEGYSMNQLSQLVYRKKQGNVTVYSAPGYYWSDWTYERAITLPVFVFDHMPAAVRAELDLEITYTYSEDTEVEATKYSLKSSREKDGYFLFFIHKEDKTALLTLGETLHRLASLSSNQMSPYTSRWDDTVPATVRLYDKNDQLIHEETVTIQSIIREAHEKHGDLPE